MTITEVTVGNGLRLESNDCKFVGSNPSTSGRKDVTNNKRVKIVLKGGGSDPVPDEGALGVEYQVAT